MHISTSLGRTDDLAGTNNTSSNVNPISKNFLSSISFPQISIKTFT